MTKHTLSNAAKSLLNFEDNTFDKPISFGDKPLPVVTQGNATADSRKYDKVPTVVFDAIKYMEDAEKIDSDEFHKFLADKNANMNIKTGQDIFDKAKFEADVREIERQYNAESQWLKNNMPTSPEAMSQWNARLAARDALRAKLPVPNHPKYHSPEIIVCTKSGLECKAILDKFNDSCKQITETLEAGLLEKHIDEHRIEMKEDMFSFLKMMHALGQCNYDFMRRIPGNVIRTNAWTDATNDLENALWNFNTVAAYNESLKSKTFSLPHDLVVTRDTQRAALMTSDIELAARAILQYATEFIALQKIDSLDKPLV